MITGFLILLIILVLAVCLIFMEMEKSAKRAGSPSEGTLQTVLESIGDPVLLFDAKEKIAWSNMAADRIFGNILGLECKEKFHHRGDVEQKCSVSEVFRKGKILSYEKKVKVWSGEERLFLISTAPVRDDEGEIRSVVKSFRDLSQITHLEKTAAQTELKYMRLFENMSEGFAYHKLVTDENSKPVDYIFLEINRAFEQLTGLRREDLIGKKVTEVLPGLQESEFDWIGTFGRVALTGEPVRFEQYAEPLQKWYAVSGYCPSPGTFAAIFEDITDRKGRDQMARASLEEKEILMREIHHRVNSNLRSISRILNVQSSYIPEEWDWTSKVLRDTQVRVMSMGLIHECLYDADDLSRISLAVYTRVLVGKLFEHLATADSMVEINIEIPDELTLNVETATLCGLIITELVSNSLKHAFAQGEAGKISISFMVGEDGLYVLEEKDNGSGIPDHVNFIKPETLGLQLLNSYVEMMDGELTVNRDEETLITVSFMENEETDSVIY